jgi:DNA replication protein DnaC
MPASRKSSKRTFADFIADEPTLVSALAAARQFVAAILAHPWRDGYCLSLCGKSGNGKTMLSEIILNELRYNGWGFCSAIPKTITGGTLLNFSAGFYDMRKVSDRFKPPHFDFSVVEAMEEHSLTVLDDIGADYDPKKITASKVDRVLRSRRGKWTLATFNLPLEKIAENLDSRISSFIIRDDNKFVEIQAQDFALRNVKR